jgi:hypothetical protein
MHSASVVQRNESCQNVVHQVPRVFHLRDHASQTIVNDAFFGDARIESTQEIHERFEEVYQHVGTNTNKMYATELGECLNSIGGMTALQRGELMMRQVIESVVSTRWRWVSRPCRTSGNALAVELVGWNWKLDGFILVVRRSIEYFSF